MEQLTAILFITYNRLCYTSQTLPLLTERTPKIHSIFVYDNGSTDGTVEYLKSNFPDVNHIHYMNQNVGIAPVQNHFWEHYAHEYSYVAKIDNDTIVPYEWLDRCIDILATDEKVGVLSHFHWPGVWTTELDRRYMNIVQTDGGSFIRTPYTGGNYICRSSLTKEIGPVSGARGLKMGFTEWQLKATQKGYQHGFVFPFSFLRVLDVEDRMIRDSEVDKIWLQRQKNDMKQILESRQLMI